MQTEYRYPDGDAVNPGLTVNPIEEKTTFSVTIRHMGTATDETVKALLQQKFEVLAVDVTKKVIIVEDRRRLNEPQPT